MIKKILSAIALLTLTATADSVNLSDDHTRQALYGALEQCGGQIKEAPLDNRTVAILPFADDSEGLLSGKLKTLITSAGFTCVEGKEDPMWDVIMTEIAWDERKDDILDAATLTKLGKLKSSQVLVYGDVRVLSKTAERVYAEIELHATELETKQHIWGGTFAYRFYPGRDLTGIISLDNDIRILLKKNFDEAAESLRKQEISKYDGVTVIPLAGDIDQYLTGLAFEMLSSSGQTPRKAAIPSLTQFRSTARDGQFGGNAVLYGAVRDLSARKVAERFDDDVLVIDEEIQTDIQLFLEDVENNHVVWSKTVTLSEKRQVERQFSAEEYVAYQKAEMAKFDAKTEVDNRRREEEIRRREEKISNAENLVKEDLVDNWKKYLGIIIWGVVGIVVLVVIGGIAKGIYSNVKIR